MGASVRCRRSRASSSSFLAPYDALLTPALAERPLPLGTLDTAAPDPMSTFTRSGLFTPFTPVFNASGQPGISLPLYQGEDGLPLGVQLVGRPAGEGALLALAAQLEAALPWAAASANGRGVGAERGGVAREHAARRCGARRALARRDVDVIETSISSASSHVANARGPAMRLEQAQCARDDAAWGRALAARLRPSERSSARTISLMGERLGPRELVADVALPRSAARSAAITQPATSSAQIGWNAARPRPDTGIAGSSARRSSSVSQGSPGA